MSSFVVLTDAKRLCAANVGPLWNNTEAISDSDLITLQSRFKLWHNPIPSLINGTNQIVKTEAISFKRVIKGIKYIQ